MTSPSTNVEATSAGVINARGIMRGGAIAGTLFAAVMLLLTAGGIAPGVPLLDSADVDAAAAGTPPVGPLSFEPTSGNSDQLFTIGPSPLPGICPGDSANDGFAVDTFMTSISNDPATLTYNAAGPVGAGFVQPLFDRFGTPIINKNTAPDTGRILSLGPAQFSVFGPGGIPAGRYYVGIACTKLGVTETFWSSTIEVTADAAAGGTSEVQIALVADTTPTTTTTVPSDSTTTTTTTVAGATTTTTVAGATTTTTVAGATTTTTVAGGAAQTATLSPPTPTPGGTYRVTHPNCRVGDTITVSQPQSTPTTQTATCAVPVAGLVRPQQASTVGTATVTFTAAPTAAGTYTVTSSGPNSGTRTATFTITSTTSTGSASGSGTSSSTGTIPATGSSTTSVIVWGVLLLVFGRIAILLGRKPKVLTGT